jgi:predicted metal-dependent phosphoesterase TrpH
MRLCLALALLLAPVAAHAEDGRMLVLQASLNPVLHPTYSLGPALSPGGRQVQIMSPLADQHTATGYRESVEAMAADPAVLAERLSAVALLAAVGSPAQENLGVLVFSNSDAVPTVAGLNVLYGRVNRTRAAKRAGEIAFDGHIHTGRSHDGGDSYEAVFLAAAARGLDAIAITDHNEFDYARASQVLDLLKRQGRMPQGFVLVPGEEVSSADGHVLAYFIHTRIVPDMSVEETIRQIHAQGGVAVAPHPSGGGGVGLTNALTLPFDGVEVMSAANVLVLGLVRDLRASEGDLRGRFAMANSDAHAKSGVGVLYTRVVTDDLSLEGIRAALALGRTRVEVDNPGYASYQRVVASAPVRAALYPVMTYLDLKGRVFAKLAALLWVDRVTVLSNWETAALRMADGLFLPSELARISKRTSEFGKPLGLRTASIAKGPFRLAYESEDLLGYSRPEPMWKLEAKVEF